jgi:hypothetical protein
VALAIAAMLFIGCGDSMTDADRVEAYCAYGAKSETQWRGCVDHVTIEQVRGYDTRAADFALNGGDCPKTTYCAEWEERWGYCQDVSAADSICRDEPRKPIDGYDRKSGYDAKSRYDGRSGYDGTRGYATP